MEWVCPPGRATVRSLPSIHHFDELAVLVVFQMSQFRNLSSLWRIVLPTSMPTGSIDGLADCFPKGPNADEDWISQKVFDDSSGPAASHDILRWFDTLLPQPFSDSDIGRSVEVISDADQASLSIDGILHEVVLMPWVSKSGR